MIPNRQLMLACAVLLLAGCERVAAPGSQEGAGKSEARPAQRAAAAKVAPVAAPAPAPAAEDGSGADSAALASTVLKKETIAVAGEPACALTVRYGDGEEQPVTWRGESCGDILVRLSSIEDLRRIGQDSKLGEEARDDLARLPGGRAVYVEGGHSSALYPANVVNRVYEVPLAD